jgi:hypothetical protein
VESNTNQSEEKQAKPKAKSQPRKKASKKWTKTLYIAGFGMVAVGETVTKEAEAAWKKKTDVPIDGYVEKA